MRDERQADHAMGARGGVGEVFMAFLRLGLTSFGGPVAHLGYFREAFVVRRRWLTDAEYADLVALCQFLPGPASSQVGFAIGLARAGWAGAAAAFVAFTAPSAAILVAFAAAAGSIAGPIGDGALHGLKLVAVAIVAQAVWGMARSLCPDPARASIAVGAATVLAFAPAPFAMPGAILLGAAAGLSLGAAPAEPARRAMAAPVSRGTATAAGLAFVLLLIALPLAAGQSQALAMIDAFYRAGALVFGGGHVVLPLLQAEVVAPGWIGEDAFLAGYGAAQAVPGPLFTIAAYLGAAATLAPNGVAGAAIALTAVFLPGFLILIAVLPFWERLRALGPARAAMQGANAAVVGVLGSALYAPVFTGAVAGPQDFVLVLGCFVALSAWGAPSWLVVIIGAVGGVGLAFIR